MLAKHKSDPKRWLFNDTDLQKYHESYWRCPVRLVTDGTWAKLWRAPNTCRGGGAASSVLPVLALHTWPGKEGTIAGWTGPSYLSQRRIARLAGINKESVAAAIERLVALSLIKVERRPRAKYEGGYKTEYRLNVLLYPEREEPYVQLPGILFYGGTWFFLPQRASRHLYVVIACLDPIRNEDAYMGPLEEQSGNDLDWLADEQDKAIEDDEERKEAIRAKIPAKRRASGPRSISELAQFSGLQRSTVIEALRVLTTPIFNRIKINGVFRPSIPLIIKGKAPPRTPTWYAPNRHAKNWYYSFDFLNSPVDVSVARQMQWPFLLEHGDRARRRRMEE